MATRRSGPSWLAPALVVVWLLLALTSALQGRTVFAVLFAALAVAYAVLQVAAGRRESERRPPG